MGEGWGATTSVGTREQTIVVVDKIYIKSRGWVLGEQWAVEKSAREFAGEQNPTA